VTSTGPIGPKPGKDLLIEELRGSARHPAAPASEMSLADGEAGDVPPGVLFGHSLGASAHHDDEFCLPVDVRAGQRDRVVRGRPRQAGNFREDQRPPWAAGRRCPRRDRYPWRPRRRGRGSWRRRRRTWARGRNGILQQVGVEPLPRRVPCWRPSRRTGPRPSKQVGRVGTEPAVAGPLDVDGGLPVDEDEPVVDLLQGA